MNREIGEDIYVPGEGFLCLALGEGINRLGAKEREREGIEPMQPRRINERRESVRKIKQTAERRSLTEYETTVLDESERDPEFYGLAGETLHVGLKPSST